MKSISSNNKETEAIDTITNGSQIKKKKTPSILDWANFLVALALPVVIIIYTIIQNKNDSRIAQKNREQDADLANQTRQLDLFLADDQQKEMVLNNYFQFLSKLLEKHGPQLNRTDKTTIQTVARLNTLSALEQLDPRRKTLLIRTLYEAGLLYRYKNITLKNPGIIPLHNANLSHIDLSVSDDDLGYQTFFMNAFLGRMWLNGAAFRGLHIDGCSFIETNLNHGDLSGTQVVDSTNSGVEPSQQGISFVQASLKYTRFIGAWYNSDRVLFLSAKMDDVNMQHMQCHACIFANAVMI